MWFWIFCNIQLITDKFLLILIIKAMSENDIKTFVALSNNIGPVKY